MSTSGRPRKNTSIPQKAASWVIELWKTPKNGPELNIIIMPCGGRRTERPIEISHVEMGRAACEKSAWKDADPWNRVPALPLIPGTRVAAWAALNHNQMLMIRGKRRLLPPRSHYTSRRVKRPWKRVFRQLDMGIYAGTENSPSPWSQAILYLGIVFRSLAPVF